MMTFTLDPHRQWEMAWEKLNPEPYPEPKRLLMNYMKVWHWYETLDRIQWHRKRWEAFKKAFPDWSKATWGIENR